MKKLLIAAFVFILASSNCMFGQENLSRVKITKIDSTQTHYFIEGKIKKQRRAKILIISEKSDFIGCVKIKEKEVYSLKLKNYLSKNERYRIPLKPKGTILIVRHNYVIWDGSRDFPYTSLNIKPLYYVENK